jgi:hypothetical protein
MNIFFCLVLFISSQIIAQKKTSLDSTIIFHTFNAEFEKAEKLIQEGRTLEPKNPKFVFFELAKNIFQFNYIVREYPLNRRNVIQDSLVNSALTKGESFLETIDEDTLSDDGKFYVGAIYGYLGRYIANESMYKAFKYGKRGRNLLRELVEEDSNYIDAYLGLGMFNYYADRLGAFIKIISSLLGFSGDRELGLEQIKKSANYGDQSYAEANATLGNIYQNMEANPEKALHYVKRIALKYKNNENFVNWYAWLLLQNHNYTDFKILLNSDKASIIRPSVLASYYFDIQDFSNSILFLKKISSDPLFIQENQIDRNKNTLALSYFLNGDQSNFNELYKSFDSKNKTELELSTKEKNIKILYQFRSLVRQNIRHEEIERIINSNPTFKIKRNKDLFNYWHATYFYKQSKLKIANKMFKTLNKTYAYQVLFKQVQIAEKLRPSEDELDDLLDELEDREFDSLYTRAKDLEEKYGY